MIKYHVLLSCADYYRALGKKMVKIGPNQYMLMTDKEFAAAEKAGEVKEGKLVKAYAQK